MNETKSNVQQCTCSSSFSRSLSFFRPGQFWEMERKKRKKERWTESKDRIKGTQWQKLSGTGRAPELAYTIGCTSGAACRCDAMPACSNVVVACEVCEACRTTHAATMHGVARGVQHAVEDIEIHRSAANFETIASQHPTEGNPQCAAHMFKCKRD